jgi:hypothetical protein
VKWLEHLHGPDENRSLQILVCGVYTIAVYDMRAGGYTGVLYRQMRRLEMLDGDNPAVIAAALQERAAIHYVEDLL